MFEEEGVHESTVPAELNGPQAEAAAHTRGPLVVFAGAGSGKTRVITYRIANLLATERVAPYRLLAVTFTNKAAGEMRHRLEGLVGPELTKDLWVGTFHATCARILRRYHEPAGLGRSFVIYDDTDQRSVMNRVFKELKVDEKRYSVRNVLGRIHKEKQEGVTSRDFVPGVFGEDVIARCFEAYERHLSNANAVDFDDLLLKVLALAESRELGVGEELRNKFLHVLVDEFQDVNQVQYRLVRAFSERHQNLCVVGDDDQSIYRWRGADVRILRSFRKDFPSAKIVKLEQNYRSSKNVVSAALSIIQRTQDREPKELWTANPAGEPVTVVATGTERDEAAFVVGRIGELVSRGEKPSEIAVFYRMHAQSRVLEEVLRAERIPHQVIGGVRFFERAEVKDLVSYLRVLVNPASDVDLLRIINVPARKIGDSTIEKLSAFAAEQRSSLHAAIPGLVESGRLGPQPRKSLASFARLLADLGELARTASPSEIAEAVLDESGYRRMLSADESTEGEARLLNLAELVGALVEYEEEELAAGGAPTLAGWLERVTLSANADELKDAPKVALMTAHAAKGLEFSYVFLTGMEEDTFPYRSQDPTRRHDPEEERRLAYVAVTRARRKLWITHAERRSLFGGVKYCAPSSFLGDIPPELIEHKTTETLRASSGRFIDRESFVPERPRLAWSHPQAASSGAMRPRQTSLSFGSREPGERYVEHEPGERFVERDEPQTRRRAEGPQVGDRVTNKAFGYGRVVAVDGGPDPTATVDFVGWGKKRVKARFLEPT
ncbi:MAG: UvrD-helicase domain-containing protein [Myxococcales bacterium]|nr:UvrD-helicase domain-containing protein [Myxococcales bacterium]